MEIRNSNEDRVMSQQQYYKSRFDRIRESKWFPLTVVTVCVLGFSGIVSYAYNQGTKANLKESAAPLIQADAGAFKTKPVDEGGMEIPFQDSLVYEQLDSNRSGEEAESLLPPPEQPMERPEPVEQATQAVENTTTETENLAKSVGDKIAEAEAEVQKQKDLASKQAAEDVTVTIGSGFANETPEAPTAPKETAAKETSPAPTSQEKELITSSTAQALSDIEPSATTPTAPTSYSAGSYHVQLGSFRDQAAAQAAWTKFKKDFAPALDGVASNIERADLGDKGIYYRVQGTNLSKASAESVCSAINGIKSGACLVKK